MATRVSNEQIEELLDYLSQNPGLARGVGLGIRSKETSEKMWNELAIKLNSYGSGSTKSGDRWKKYWADLKHKSKSRLAKRKTEHTGTGGGPSSHGQLNDLDNKILSIIGEQAVYGDTQHKIPFNFTDPVENDHEPLGSDHEELPDVQFGKYEMENSASTPVRHPYEFSSQAITTLRPSCSTDSHKQQAETSEYHEVELPQDPLLTDLETVSLPRTQTIPKKRLQSPAGQLSGPAKRSVRPQPPQATKANLSISNENLQPKPRATPAWVMDIEKKRVVNETKLADAAMIMAEAARNQSQAALAQVQINQTLLEIVRRQSRDIRSLLIMLRGEPITQSHSEDTVQSDQDSD